MFRPFVHCMALTAINLVLSQVAIAQSNVQTPNDGAQPPLPHEIGPDGPNVLRVPDEIEENPALGPLDPGPFPQMPGYFSKKAIDLNYRQTPFFGGRGNNYGGIGPYGGQDYYPGVYPYYDAQRQYRWYIDYRRERQLVKRADNLRGDGLTEFQSGQYEAAAVRLLGASEHDHGDAASRVHAGHALFAVGRYADAAKLLRRAFDLQPTLAYLKFDPRADYGRPADFDLHLATLRNFVRQNSNDASANLLLGYLLFYTQGSSAAKPSLDAALRLAPNDSLARLLAGVTSKTATSERVARVSGQVDKTPYDQLKRAPKAAPAYDEMRVPVRQKAPSKKAKDDTRRI